MTRLAVGRPTPAVSPQNGTKSDLRWSEIKKFSCGDMSPHVPHPLACPLLALYAISRVHTGTPLFKILDPPLLPVLSVLPPLCPLSSPVLSVLSVLPSCLSSQFSRPPCPLSSPVLSVLSVLPSCLSSQFSLLSVLSSSLSSQFSLLSVLSSSLSSQFSLLSVLSSSLSSQFSCSVCSLSSPVLSIHRSLILFGFLYPFTPSGKKKVTGVQVVTASQVQSIECRWQAISSCP